MINMPDAATHNSIEVKNEEALDSLPGIQKQSVTVKRGLMDKNFKF